MVEEDEQTEQETVTEEAGGEKEREGEVEVEAEGGEGLGGEVGVEDYEEMNTTQSVVGEPVEEEGGKEVVVGGEGEEGRMEESVVVVEEEKAGAEVMIGEPGGETIGGEEERDGESVEEEEGDEGVVVGAADQLGGEAGGGEGGEAVEEETPATSQTENQEVLLDPGESSMRSIPGDSQDPASPLSPHHPGGETESNTMRGEEILEDVDLESNDANKIITFKDNLLNFDPDEATSTLDNFVEDIPAMANEEEPGETNEEVEVTTGADNSESGLEAWKIGAISAAVFLVLETIVIIVYVLKCRDKTNSSPARLCEEGRVEVETGTALCNEDTLPAGDEECQQIAVLDPWELDPSQTQQQLQQEEDEVEMKDLQLTSIEDLTNRPVDPSHDVQTSVL
ncbi:cyclic nucleotide-gated cation channel beta-1 [Salmo salar]|uniref:Cyclic nucleotide-gated cation channel beta-1 n=1 Tax=Salmo salar TaxID=8030 RepID=A0ABM3EB82_SALSA|nr:cyclic nucleotide-gated cation channel beta-1 [Salmo salar]